MPGTLIETTEEGGSGGGYSNACYFIDKSGEVLHRYRKKNLWHPERPHLDSDVETPHGAFDTPWGKVGMLICWDVAFPEAFRALVHEGARLVICPTYWTATDAGKGLEINPESETRFLESVCVTRAYENTCAVAFVNTGAPKGQVKDDATGLEFVGLSHVAMPFHGALGKLGTGEDVSIVNVALDNLNVAEEVYKVREDMKREEWHYAHTILKK